jgi:hypothetical protein
MVTMVGEVEVRRGSETRLRVVSLTISPFGIGSDFESPASLIMVEDHCS